MSVDHYENFPVASILCPPALRPSIAAIYGFARTADDLADEGDVASDQRLRDLHDYRADLQGALHGTSTSNRWPEVFGPLRRVVVDKALPEALLTDLLSAFEQDVVRDRYADRADVLDYCRRSANPVGRLLLHLYRVDDALSLRRSDDICTALQLANFWQDLSIDSPRGRIYVPATELARHGVSQEELLSRTDGVNVHAMVADLVTWTRELMLRGAPLVHSINGRAGWELRLVVQGGLRILERIERIGFATLTKRPKLHAYDAPLLLWRASRMRLSNAFVESSPV